ncbi:MAG: hypothetical protein KJ587_13315 [Alphaproteobacteria bacterium]|nr:hypothetical protein [Alphaproteobacteria bacterium]
MTDEILRWQQPIKMRYRTRRLTWDRAWPRTDSGWNRQERPPDSAVVELDLPVGPLASYDEFLSLESKVLTQRMAQHWEDPDRRKSRFFEQLSMIQGHCECILGLLLRSVYCNRNLPDGTSGLQPSKHVDDCNFLVLDVGCWEKSVDGPAGTWTGLPVPPKVKQLAKDNELATQYAVSPFCITAWHSIGNEIVGATVAYFYSFATFLQEQRFLDSVRTVREVRSASQAYKHVYWKCTDDMIYASLVSYVPAGLDSFDLRYLETLPADYYRTRKNEMQVVNHIDALRSCREFTYLNVGMLLGLLGPNRLSFSADCKDAVSLQNVEPHPADFGSTWLVSLASNCLTPRLCAELRHIARGRAFVEGFVPSKRHEEHELKIIQNTFPETQRLPGDTPPYRRISFDASVSSHSILASPLEPPEPTETAPVMR